MKREALIRLSGGQENTLHVGQINLCHRGTKKHNKPKQLQFVSSTQTFALLTHPFVQLQPGREPFAVLVLEPEEPGFPQPDGLDDLKRRSSGLESVVPGGADGNLTPAHCTWSKSCLPVVLGRMANSSSASMVVTRTFSYRGGKNYQTEIWKKQKFLYVEGKSVTENKEHQKTL